jgi:NAD(P)H-quinone oxidoreductase subunit K
VIKLRKKIANESMQERGYLQQVHRYYTRDHKMTVVDPILTGKYLRAETRQAPPKELTPAMGMPLSLTEAEKVERQNG